MKGIRCYSMYGLMGGPFPYGLYYSAGLDLLSAKLKKLGPNIDIRPAVGWSKWKIITRDLADTNADTGIVLYGHSMGANQLFEVAAKSPRKIDLIAAFDPTFWYPIQRIGGNVRHVIWFRGTSFFSPFGHGRVRTKADFQGKFEKYNVRVRHERIDDQKDLHSIIIRAVQMLMTQETLK